MGVWSVGIDLSLQGAHRLEALDEFENPCGHLSFGTTPEGLEALSQVCAQMGEFTDGGDGAYRIGLVAHRPVSASTLSPSCPGTGQRTERGGGASWEDTPRVIGWTPLPWPSRLYWIQGT